MARSGYDFYLGKCLLPIAPQKLQVKINNANDTLTLINEGQINLLKEAELTEIEFECEIPQVPYPFAVYKSGFQKADYFLGYFESLKTAKRPFQFIVSRTMPTGKILFAPNMKVSLESYTITEQAKNGFDITVKISLKQYRDFGTKTVDIRQTDAGATATVQETRETDMAPDTSAAQTYVVKKGDCLWNIAKQFYGSGAKYTAIYDANSGVVGGNPNLIYPGQVLTIPAI